MVGSKVRLRYSTITNYASMIYRMVVALGFAVIVARRLSIGEFGLWGVILSSSLMLSTPVMLWSMWAQRFLARGHTEAGLTGLYLSFVYIIPGSLVYLAFSLIEQATVGWGFSYMLLGLPLLLLQVLDSYLRSLAGVVRPEIRGYRNFVYETLRILLVYISIVLLGLRLNGVIYSVELALLVAVGYMWLSLRSTGVFKDGFSKELAVDWLKAWFFPSLNLLLSFMRSGLRAVVSWITGSEQPVAFLNVGFSAETPLLQASWTSTLALYARALRKKSGRDLEETMRLTLLFIGYMLPVFTVLSKTIASIYNPAYVVVWPVLVIVSIYAVLNGFTSIYATVLLGTEKIDAYGIPDRKSLLSSRLFKVPFVQVLGFAGAYAVFSSAIIILKLNSLQTAEIVAGSLLVCNIPVLIYLARETRREIEYRFPFKELVGVSVSSLASAIYYLSVGAENIVVLHFWQQLPVVLLHLTVGLGVYLAVLLLVSKWMRKLVRDAFYFTKRTFSMTKVSDSRH